MGMVANINIQNRINIKRNKQYSMRIVLPFLFSLIIFSSCVSAQFTTYTSCLDNTTLGHYTNTQLTVPQTNTQRTLITVENQTCPWGCDTTHNLCFSSPATNWLIGAIIVLALIVGSYFIYLTFGRGG